MDLVEYYLAEAQGIVRSLLANEASEGRSPQLARVLELVGLARVEHLRAALMHGRREIRVNHLGATTARLPSGKTIECGIADISPSGAAIVLPTELDCLPGSRLELALPWLDRAIPCEVRSLRDSIAHVYFGELSERDRLLLDKATQSMLTD